MYHRHQQTPVSLVRSRRPGDEVDELLIGSEEVVYLGQSRRIDFVKTGDVASSGSLPPPFPTKTKPLKKKKNTKNL